MNGPLLLAVAFMRAGLFDLPASTSPVGDGPVRLIIR